MSRVDQFRGNHKTSGRLSAAALHSDSAFQTYTVVARCQKDMARLWSVREHVLRLIACLYVKSTWGYLVSPYALRDRVVPFGPFNMEKKSYMRGFGIFVIFMHQSAWHKAV